MTAPHRHLEDDEILELRLSGAQSGDAATVDVAACEFCARRFAETDQFIASLVDPATWRASQSNANDFDRGLAALQAETSDYANRERVGAQYWRALQDLPRSSWSGEVTKFDPNEHLTRRLINAAVAELDHAPEETLLILDAAEASTTKLQRQPAAEYRSEIWKNRANSLRMQGNFEEALAATARAARYTRLCPTGSHSLGQVIYTRGTILFKMGRYAEARDCADAAIEYLREFGDRRRIAYATNLKASACTEEGQLEEALGVYSALRSELEDLGDTDAVARVLLNITVAHLRLGNLKPARKFAIEALQRFIDSGSQAEELRARWVLATLRSREGDRDGAFTQLRSVAAEFEGLGMHGDAARVKLEIAEELLRSEDWEAAESVARDAAETFAKNDARLHLAEALGYLWQAVEERTAMPELAEYVRFYLEADDSSAPFAPPGHTHLSG